MTEREQPYLTHLDTSISFLHLNIFLKIHLWQLKVMIKLILIIPAMNSLTFVVLQGMQQLFFMTERGVGRDGSTNSF